MTGPEEVGSSTIEASWAGGIDGRQVIDTFLPMIPKLLSSNGVFYMVVINENNPKEIMDLCKDRYGLKGSVWVSLYEPTYSRCACDVRLALRGCLY